MGTQSRMNTLGQITVPDDVREALGIRPGDLVMFTAAAGLVGMSKGTESANPSFEERLARARALASPLPLGMTTDEYMSWIRDPLPELDGL